MDDTNYSKMDELNDKHTQMVFTLAKDGRAIRDQLEPEMCDLWHHATGVCTEAGELLDAIKKHVIYGKDIDLTNVVEELGDLEFYLAGIRLNLGITRRKTLHYNMDKLAVRYKNYQYSDEQAQARADKVGDEMTDAAKLAAEKASMQDFIKGVNK